jgi:hypothetical protein
MISDDDIKEFNLVAYHDSLLRLAVPTLLKTPISDLTNVLHITDPIDILNFRAFIDDLQRRTLPLPPLQRQGISKTATTASASSLSASRNDAKDHKNNNPRSENLFVSENSLSSCMFIVIPHPSNQCR